MRRGVSFSLVSFIKYDFTSGPQTHHFNLLNKYSTDTNMKNKNIILFLFMYMQQLALRLNLSFSVIYSEHHPHALRKTRAFYLFISACRSCFCVIPELITKAYNTCIFYCFIGYMIFVPFS